MSRPGLHGQARAGVEPGPGTNCIIELVEKNVILLL